MDDIRLPTLKKSASEPNLRCLLFYGGSSSINNNNNILTVSVLEGQLNHYRYHQYNTDDSIIKKPNSISNYLTSAVAKSSSSGEGSFLPNSTNITLLTTDIATSVAVKNLVMN